MAYPLYGSVYIFGSGHIRCKLPLTLVLGSYNCTRNTPLTMIYILHIVCVHVCVCVCMCVAMCSLEDSKCGGDSHGSGAFPADRWSFTHTGHTWSQ